MNQADDHERDCLQIDINSNNQHVSMKNDWCYTVDQTVFEWCLLTG